MVSKAATWPRKVPARCSAPNSVPAREVINASPIRVVTQSASASTFTATNSSAREIAIG